MNTFIAPSDPRERATTFLRAYISASDDADIAVRIGRSETTGEAAVFFSVDEAMHAFSSKEARILADVLESTLAAHPNEKESDGLPNLILALRFGADRSEVG